MKLLQRKRDEDIFKRKLIQAKKQRETEREVGNLSG